MVLHPLDLSLLADARVRQTRSALMRRAAMSRPSDVAPWRRYVTGCARVLGAGGRALGLAAAALCAACTVGPDFQAPHPDVPGDFADRARTGSGGAASVTDPSDPDPRWWRRFGDAQLDTLIDRAIAGNLDLQQAVQRIAAARAQARAAGAAGLPQVGANASYTYQQLGLKGLLESRGVPAQIDRLGAPGSPLDSVSPGAGAQAQAAGKKLMNRLEDPVNLYQAGFDASWELDLFGRVRRTVEAADAQTQAAIEARNDALVSLEAEVAQTYVQLRGAQLLTRIASEQITQDQEVLDLTRSRQHAGLASEADVERASAQLGTSQSQLPLFEQQTTQALNGLALLIGQAPGTLDTELSTPGAVPPVPPTVPVGVPASLARRRPDVRRAEADLHTATAQVGASIAQLFPDVSLTGNIGLRATEASYLTRWASHFYSIGPQIRLPIFEGGALRAQIAMARADQAAAVLAYRQTVLSALHEVDNALVRYRTDQARRQTVSGVADANRRAFELAREGYQHGLASFIDVLDTERQWSDSRVQLADATVRVTTDLVALYKALGGGWQAGGQPD
jgi:NodT family efflux transporter outer membrane factor (OMF) lipoprotein